MNFWQNYRFPDAMGSFLRNENELFQLTPSEVNKKHLMRPQQSCDFSILTSFEPTANVSQALVQEITQCSDDFVVLF